MILKNLAYILRRLSKDRLFTGLNLLGLTIGLAVTFILGSYVYHEHSFDRFHEHSDHIYRVNLTVSYDGQEQNWASAPNIAGPAFKENIKEVEEFVRMLDHNFGRTAFVSFEENHLAEKEFFWVDSSMMTLFSIPFVQGDPGTALNGPNRVIINETTASKLFAETNPIGKEIEVDHRHRLEVTGVYKDFPANSSLAPNFMASFSSLAWANDRLYWSNCSYATYLLLNPQSDPATVESEMARVLDEAVNPEDQWFRHWLQPLKEVHLESAGISNDSTTRLGNVQQTRILSWLALIVLIIACFNYINLTTAKTSKRYREIGINKTLGAGNFTLIQRFLLETSFLVVTGLICAVILIQLFRPALFRLTGSSWNVLPITLPEFWLALLLIGTVVTLISGLYPAFMAVRFTPQQILQSGFKGGITKSYSRNILVTAQFASCVCLIIGTLYLQKQLNYIGNKNLGYNPDQVLAISLAGVENQEQRTRLMNAYNLLPELNSQCRVMAYPGISTSGFAMTQPGQSDRSILVAANRIVGDVVKTLDLNLIAGRNLDVKLPKDSTVQVLMNETGVEFLGWSPEEALGKTPPNLFSYPTTIVGVVEDFHFESFHQPINPYVFHNSNFMGSSPYLLVNFTTQDVSGLLNSLKLQFEQNVPNSAFEFAFLDEHLATLYVSEKRLSALTLFFTFLAVFISCLGLLALALYTAEKRIKEIGIRKVLGASTEGLIALLTLDFIKPVLVAIVLAIPISWWLISKWAEDFVYRTSMNWWIFGIAAVGSLCIALVTVALTSYKAAMRSPVTSLKND